MCHKGSIQLSLIDNKCVNHFLIIIQFQVFTIRWTEMNNDLFAQKKLIKIVFFCDSHHR